MSFSEDKNKDDGVIRWKEWRLVDLRDECGLIGRLKTPIVLDAGRLEDSDW